MRFDGVGQEGGDAQHFEVRQALLRRQRDAVGHDDLLQRRIAAAEKRQPDSSAWRGNLNDSARTGYTNPKR
jgi:hypothetical protein